MCLRQAALAIATVVVAAACQNRTPPSPSPGPGGVETIRGTERIGWDQRAADTAELAGFRYAVYVDGSRSEIGDARCETSAAVNGFPCSGRLPAMSPGQHTLELAAFVLDGSSIVESPRSAPITVNVTASATDAPAQSSNGGGTLTTSDGVRLRVELVAEGIEEPVDLAFDPEDRLFVATRDGTVHLLSGRSQQPLRSSSLTDVHDLLSLTLAPDFARTRHVYAVDITAARDGSDAPVFRLARYREVNGVLGERAILVDGVAARPANPAAVVRAGSDGKVYVAFDDGGDARRPDSPAWLNGKLLRLNPDGTTPDDQPAANPVLVSGFHAPRGLTFLADGTMWVLDGEPHMQGRLVAAGVRALRPRAAAVRSTFTLEAGSDPADAIVYRGDLVPEFRGDLLIAAGGHLLRVRLETRLPPRAVGSEKLLDGAVDSVRAVAVRADGAIYFATSSGVARLVRQP